jgi:hypothetical protein
LHQPVVTHLLYCTRHVPCAIFCRLACTTSLNLLVQLPSGLSSISVKKASFFVVGSWRTYTRVYPGGLTSLPGALFRQPTMRTCWANEVWQ